MRPVASRSQQLDANLFEVVNFGENWVQVRRLADGETVEFDFDDSSPVPPDEFDTKVFDPALPPPRRKTVRIQHTETPAEQRMHAVVEAFLRQNRDFGRDFAEHRRRKLIDKRVSQKPESRRESCGGCGMMSTQIKVLGGWECSCCSKVWP